MIKMRIGYCHNCFGIRIPPKNKINEVHPAGLRWYAKDKCMGKKCPFCKKEHVVHEYFCEVNLDSLQWLIERGYNVFNEDGVFVRR